ncbi:MAG: flagellar protein FliS [Defluviitaleaceae bacterium]|nr:flagellar protein FliS [Defluviitaleaceae bacterium]
MLIKKEEYETRVATATPLGLVIINYELLLDYIDASISSVETDEFDSCVENAINSNGLLMDSLDLSYEIGRELMSIYIYVSKILVDARRIKDIELLKEAKELVSILFESWQEIAKSDDGTPILSNSKVYEGLTYKDGKLTEMIVESDQNDFKA